MYNKTKIIKCKKYQTNYQNYKNSALTIKLLEKSYRKSTI